MIAVMTLEEARRHSAYSRMGSGGSRNLLQFELTVIVAVDHVARHVGIPPVHVFEHPLLGDELSGVSEQAAPFDMVPVAVTIDDVPHGHAWEALR